MNLSRRRAHDWEVKEYTETIAKVAKATLGYEDHGIFTCMLHLDYGSSAQGAGGYALDAPRHTADGEFIGRFGTAYGMEFVIRLMRAAGVDDWSKLAGRTVLALRGEDYHSKVEGIAPLPTERGERFIFDELAAEFEERG